MSQAGKLSEGNPSIPGIETLTGDSGGAVPGSGSPVNIDIVGGSGITTVGDPGTSTLTIDISAGRYPISPYVVGPIGQADYQTIQAGIDAANAAGGGEVYIQPGQYTENLTLYNNVDLVGAQAIAHGDYVNIIGTHTPPTSGNVRFYGVSFTANSGSVFSSAAAGTTNLLFDSCITTVTSGYMFDLVNWTGDLVMFAGEIGGAANSFVNNTGGSTVIVYTLTLGTAVSGTAIIHGDLLMVNTQCSIALNLGGSGVSSINGGCQFTNAITLSDSHALTMQNSAVDTGAITPFTTTSSGELTLEDININTSNSTAIAGTGGVTFGNVSYADSCVVAGTITQTYERAIGRMSPYIVGPSGNFATIQAALDAANAAGGGTVYVQPGTYTEDLTLYSMVTIVGLTGVPALQDVKIVGTHTPPLTGSFSTQHIYWSGTNAVISSAAAGTATITFEEADLEITGTGPAFDVPNWAGEIFFFDIDTHGANNSFIDNSTGSADFALFNMTVGNSVTAATMQFGTGNVLITNVQLGVEVQFNGGSFNIQGGSWIYNTITASSNSTGHIVNSYFDTGAAPAFTMSSSGAVTLANCVINSSNNPSITGAGAGSLTVANCSFLDNDQYTGGLTVDYTFQGAAGEGTTGQVLTSNGPGNLPTWENSTNGSWEDQSGVFNAASGTNYFLTAASTATLPGSPSQGDTIRFAVNTAGACVITANTGQTIRVSSTTSSVAGTATNTANGDCLHLVYNSTSTLWMTVASMGNWVLA